MIYWLVSLHDRGSFAPGFSRSYGAFFSAVNPPAAPGPNKIQLAAMILSKTEASYLNEGEWRCDDANADVIDVNACTERFVCERMNCK